MIYRVTFEPRAPIFFGLNTHARKGAALVHSDTLHAALIDAAALAGLPVVDIAEHLRVSSVFPCWSGIFFYPKPYLPVPAENSTPDEHKPSADRKRLKSIRWVSETLLDAWLRGDHRPFVQEGAIETIASDAMITAEEAKKIGVLPDKLVVRDLAPAVTVDRISSAASPFERRGIRLWHKKSDDDTRENVKAWFLADVPNSHKADFEKTVELLGIYGLGGERSIGYGHFDNIEFDHQPNVPWLQSLPGAPEPDMFYTISLYLPTENEVQAGVLDSPAAYDCTIREGWIHDRVGTTFFKKSTRMCLEGSVFKKVAEQHGEIRDVRPDAFHADHPVLRLGKAFEFFFRKGEK